jgi:hypothetical protein
MNINITDVATGKQLHNGTHIAVYATAANGAVFRHNELCDTRDHGDMLTTADEVMYLATEDGIEMDEWTLVRGTLPANLSQEQTEIEEIRVGKTISNGRDAYVYAKGTDGSVWRYTKRLCVDAHYPCASVAERFMNWEMGRGYIDQQNWTKVRAPRTAARGQRVGVAA